MKNLSKLFLVAFAAVLLTSCSKDSEGLVNADDANFTSTIKLNAKQQTPNRAFDDSNQGIYHGVIASGTTAERGKIWINMGNDTEYDAFVELVDGRVFEYVLVNSFATSTQLETTFKFYNEESTFTLNTSDQGDPVITDAKIKGQEFFASVIKSNFQGRAMASTGTFTKDNDLSFTGTFNILANGATDPNNAGFGGSEITEVMLTFDGGTTGDTFFETFDTCYGPNSKPEMAETGPAGAIVAAQNQTSDFRGMTTWKLLYIQDFGGYHDESCNTVTSGTYSRINGDGQTVTGKIYLD